VTQEGVDAGPRRFRESARRCSGAWIRLSVGQPGGAARGDGGCRFELAQLRVKLTSNARQFCSAGQQTGRLTFSPQSMISLLFFIILGFATWFGDLGARSKKFDNIAANLFLCTDFKITKP
jgi:hypothetical protein